MTGAQVQEARKLLGWSRYRLEHQCGLSHAALYQFEKTGNMRPSMFPRTDQVNRLARLRAVFEAHGVVFTDEDGSGPAVKLRVTQT